MKINCSDVHVHSHSELIWRFVLWSSYNCKANFFVNIWNPKRKGWCVGFCFIRLGTVRKRLQGKYWQQMQNTRGALQWRWEQQDPTLNIVKLLRRPRTVTGLTSPHLLNQPTLKIKTNNSKKSCFGSYPKNYPPKVFCPLKSDQPTLSHWPLPSSTTEHPMNPSSTQNTGGAVAR